MPLQASYHIGNEDTLKREFDGLYAACKVLKQNTGRIVTFEEEFKINYKDIEIEIVPVYKYMLNL